MNITPAFGGHINHCGSNRTSLYPETKYLLAITIMHSSYISCYNIAWKPGTGMFVSVTDKDWGHRNL